MTAIDIGANIGWITILMAQAVGRHGKVYAFEPSPDIFRQLELNVALNNLSQVSVQCLALSNITGTVPFHIFPEGFEVYNSIGAWQRREGQSANRVVDVPVGTLDDYCQENNLAVIDFIKIDVEGAEELVLKGAQNILQQNPQVKIMIELFEPSAKQCGCSISTIMELFRDMGFKPYYLNPVGNLEALSLEECKLTAQGQNPKYNFVFQQPLIKEKNLK
jgi:FkbM family methyltransferase